MKNKFNMELIDHLINTSKIYDLYKYSDCKDDYYRKFVVLNTKYTLDILEKFLNDKSSEIIKYNIVYNSNCDENLLIKLANSGSFLIECAVIINEKCTYDFFLEKTLLYL